MTLYVPRRPLGSTLEDPRQSDLIRAAMRSTVPLGLKGRVARTRRARKQGQCWDDGVRRDDGVICNLCAVFDDCEFPLRTRDT